VEGHEGGGEEEEGNGARAERGLPAIPVEEGLEDEREEDACEAGAALYYVKLVEGVGTGRGHTQTMPKARPFFSTNQSDRKRMDGV
jgi:hypothetical protein